MDIMAALMPVPTTVALVSAIEFAGRVSYFSK
jgi:hypothetical protein